MTTNFTYLPVLLGFSITTYVLKTPHIQDEMSFWVSCHFRNQVSFHIYGHGVGDGQQSGTYQMCELHHPPFIPFLTLILLIHIFIMNSAQSMSPFAKLVIEEIDSND